MKETYYFAYGSNMNLDQMAYRCARLFPSWRMSGWRDTTDLLWQGERKRCCHHFFGRGQPGGRGALEDHTEDVKKPGLL